MSRGGDWAGVLFDLDGTLADTIELILRCYRHTMETHLGEVLPDEGWLAGIGTPLRTQLLTFARSSGEAEAMLGTYVAFQRTIHDGMVEPYPGIVDLIGSLRSRGVPLAVVTSKGSEMTARTLEVCGIADAFATVVTADQVERGKPDPEPVLLALERMGLSAEAARTLFVGDSPFDLRAGRAAGTRTAAALWGPFSHDALEAEGPDFRLRDPRDLIELRP